MTPLDAHDDRPLSPSRRHFLKRSSMAALLGLSATSKRSEAAAPLRTPPDDETVGIALVGFGPWGREIADTLGRLPEARLLAVCDTYDVMLRRAQRSVPDASRHTDYREVLDREDVQAVIVATPSHQHRQIVVDALAAGKHVYCEAPMASSLDDARAIARAARDAEGQIFQVGLQYRTEPQHRDVFGFIRSGAIGRPVMARGQWHKKESWRRTSPSREREREQNWRLDAALSTGLPGEIGIHQFDKAAWLFNERPTAVSGFGQLMLWDDGRDVPDTVQLVLTFPNRVHLLYDATLASSYDGMYDLYHGSDSTIILRESKAWMFKEVDAPMLGWEVYARKDKFYKETGIALVANATKLDALGQDPAADDPNVESPLWYALRAFTDNFFFGPYEPAASYQVGFEATVVAAKAHEAVMNDAKVDIAPSDYEIG